MKMLKIGTLLLCAAFLPGTNARAQSVSIGVLGIFHPQELSITPAESGELLVSGTEQEIFVRASSDCSAVHIRALQNALLAKCGKKELRAQELHATSRDQEAVTFFVAIPGKIKRGFRGILRVSAKDGVLVTVVEMDVETAVGSVVRAEMTADAPIEVLKAQAVVSRSYFTAGGGRHADFDFCDLTHCQFLREPPRPDSPAAIATAETRGMVLIYQNKPVASMFTRSCGGHTRTPQDVGISTGAYPYFSVRCDFCYKNPVRWTRIVSPEDAALLLRSGEAGRLAIGRRLGWNAVPSNNFTAHKTGTEVVLDGMGQGHGIGFCQRGAMVMASDGATFRAILEHYFPNTNVETSPAVN